MNNFIQDGRTLPWTNDTGADIASGDPVVIGNLIGVAAVDIADGASGSVAIEGVFSLPKVSGSSGHAISQGSKVLFDVSVGKFDVGTATAAAGDISGCCVAVAAAATTATTVDIKLNVGIGTIEAGS
jgi:predicted RecA/RadA family phage recombinase